jgi:hypothetical protein
VEEEIEIVENPDGTSTIKVVRSKRHCHEVTRPFEDAKGKVAETKPIANPGQVGQGVQNRR